MARGHKHNYRVISVKRAEKRGMVIVKYHCTNRVGYCDKPYKTQQESADKYQ